MRGRIWVSLFLAFSLTVAARAGHAASAFPTLTATEMKHFSTGKLSEVASVFSEFFESYERQYEVRAVQVGPGPQGTLSQKPCFDFGWVGAWRTQLTGLRECLITNSNFDRALKDCPKNEVPCNPGIYGKFSGKAICVLSSGNSLSKNCQKKSTQLHAKDFHPGETEQQLAERLEKEIHESPLAFEDLETISRSISTDCAANPSEACAKVAKSLESFKKTLGKSDRERYIFQHCEYSPVYTRIIHSKADGKYICFGRLTSPDPKGKCERFDKETQKAETIDGQIVTCPAVQSGTHWQCPADKGKCLDDTSFEILNPAAPTANPS
jgi:hypothetical protein